MDGQELLEFAANQAACWTQEPYDSATQAETKALLEAGGDALIEAFYTDLEFGTGGLRGLMGVGTNRMNAYTVAQATQGLANYMLQAVPEGASIAIAHDSRNRSAEFARVAAEVMAGNGIEVHLFPALRPTPQLSFTVRHLGCTAGIVVTASHNPKEYNGYKVYWSDGGQIVPPHDKGIIDCVRAVAGPAEVKWGKNEADQKRIHLLDGAADQAYWDTVLNLRLSENLKTNGSDLSIVYTPLHGTGSASVIPVLNAAGFRNVHIVESQREPDGNFPTVHSPNPEEGAALSEAIELAKTVGAHLVLGTDPDADRVGIAVPDDRAEGGWRLLNGNETGALLVDYVVSERHRHGLLKAGDFVAKTIVTSDLMAEVGKRAGLAVHETLTGFKWIADVIRRMEGKGAFIAGGEESYGYMIGDKVRDKDAVAAACMLCELAHEAHASGTDLVGRLEKIHAEHGAFKEALVSQTKHGRSGKAEIAAQMEGFRSSPPQTLAGETVVEVRDYAAQSAIDPRDGTERKLDLPSSNVVQLVTENQTVVTARPSGTEPKIKFYFSVRQATEDWLNGDYQQTMAALENRIGELKKEMGVA